MDKRCISEWKKTDVFSVCMCVCVYKRNNGKSTSIVVCSEKQLYSLKISK